MLILNPARVMYDGVDYEGVASLNIERQAAQLAVDWGDPGPHAVFADVPEQRVAVRLVQRLAGDVLDAPKPGQLGDLAFTAAPKASDAARRSWSCKAMVTRVSYQLTQDARTPSTRTIDFVALSDDGARDPISIA